MTPGRGLGSPRGTGNVTGRRNGEYAARGNNLGYNNGSNNAAKAKEARDESEFKKNQRLW